jgi:hypothetical protein
MRNAEDRDLARFLLGEVAAAELPHREHVRMAFEILRRHDFLESARLYADALRVIAGRAGHPQAFSLTITLAFLALIAERMAATAAEDFAGFAARNPEVMDKALLRRWYSPERLTAPLGRSIFLLPEPCR